MAAPSRERLSFRIADVALLAMIAALPIATFYFSFHFAGPQWDMTVRELSGRTLLNYLTHGMSARGAFVGEFTNNLLYYFEPYREPLPTPIYAVLLLFTDSPVLPYMVLTYAAFLAALLFLARDLAVDRLAMFAAMVNGYTIYFLFVPNGGEGLSVVFVIIGLVFLFRRRPVSGLFLGIAALAKYPSIALFPMVLFLDNTRDRLQAIGWEALALSAWGIADYALYGVPFYSYFASISASNVVAGPAAISLNAMLDVFIYGAIFAGIAAAYLIARKQRVLPRMDRTSRILVAFLILSIASYAFMLPHNNASTQERYGYLAAISVALPAAMLLGRASSQSAVPKYAAAAVSVAILLWVAYSASLLGSSPGVTYYNPDSNASVYTHAASELSALGFQGCRFISNAWVPMLASGYDAYSPFILYRSGVIGPIVEGLLANGSSSGTEAYDAYLAQEARYPIVVIDYAGVPQSLIVGLNASDVAYRDANITIYLPENASCYGAWAP